MTNGTRHNLQSPLSVFCICLFYTNDESTTKYNKTTVSLSGQLPLYTTNAAFLLSSSDMNNAEDLLKNCYARRYGSYSFCNARTGAATFGSESLCYFPLSYIDEGGVLYLTILSYKYYTLANLKEPRLHLWHLRLDCDHHVFPVCNVWDPQRVLMLSIYTIPLRLLHSTSEKSIESV